MLQMHEPNYLFVVIISFMMVKEQEIKLIIYNMMNYLDLSTKYLLLSQCNKTVAYIGQKMATEEHLRFIDAWITLKEELTSLAFTEMSS